MIPAAAFSGVLEVVVGVILALGGLAVAFMGGSAMTEGVVKRGGYALLTGLVLAAVGLWLIGVWG